MAKAATDLSDWPANGLPLGGARWRLVDPSLLSRLLKAESAVMLREPFAEKTSVIKL
jgi:hypothetical protein